MPSPLLFRDHLANRHVLAILKEDAAGVIAVEVFVVVPVAVECEVLDDHTGDVLARDQGKEGRGGRLSLEPQVLAQRPVELEPVSRPGHKRSLDHDLTAVLRVLRSQADAVAEPEPSGVGQGDFLVVPVGVGGQLGGG